MQFSYLKLIFLTYPFFYLFFFIPFHSGFGVVYRAKRRKDKKEVAIKCVTLEQDELQNEIKILRGCDNQFIVKFYESFIVSKTQAKETWVR